jgi:hypothetical protein
MLSVEDKLISKLEQRLNYVKTVSKNNKNQEALTNYFESRVHRSILDYLLQKELFDTAQAMSTELGMQSFSDIEVYREVFGIINKLKVVEKSFGNNKPAKHSQETPE